MLRLLIPFPFVLPLLFACGAAEAGISVETLSLDRAAQPGERYTVSFVVSNSDDLPRAVRIYQTDYLFSCDGSNQFGEPGEMERSNADWIRINPPRLHVPPRQAATVYCVVDVPADSALTGTFWSMIMVEEDPASDGAALPLRRDQAGIRQVVRYGVQCVTQLGNSGTERLAIIGSRLVADEGSADELQVDVENSGDRWAVPLAWTELYNENGQRVGRFETEAKRIFPGTSVRFRISLGDPPAGKYKAFVVLDNGDQNVIGAKYDLEL